MWSMAHLADTHPGALSGKGTDRNLNPFDCKARPPLVRDGATYGFNDFRTRTTRGGAASIVISRVFLQMQHNATPPDLH
jgi:hypothetical protein